MKGKNRLEQPAEKSPEAPYSLFKCLYQTNVHIKINVK